MTKQMCDSNETQNCTTHLLNESSKCSDKMPCKSLKSYVWAVMLIVFPLISSIIIGIQLFGPSETIFNTMGRIADVLLIITYMSSLIGIGITVYSSNDRSSEDDTAHTDHGNHEPHSPIVIAFFLILGYGDSLSNLTRFGDQLILILMKNYEDSECEINIMISMMENLLKCFCQLCILMFMMHQMKYSTRKKPSSSNIFILFLSIFCLIQWLLLLFQEIDQRHGKHDTCISNTSHGLNSFQSIEPFVDPLGLEFRFASFIELLIISEYGSGDKRTSTTVVVNDSFDEATMQRDERTCGTKWKHLFQSIFLPAGGILIVSVSMIIIFFQQSNIENNDHGVTLMSNNNNRIVTLMSNNNNHIVTLISESCEVTLESIISILSLYSLSKLCNRRNNTTSNQENAIPFRHKFKIDYGFLIIAIIFFILYCILAFVSAVSYTPTDTLTKAIKWLTIIASILAIIQTIIQVVVIWKISRNKTSLSEETMNLWIIMSFALWLFDTFSAKEHDTNQIQLDFYQKAWDILTPIFVPMAIFFRFHSCTVFANIKADVYS